MIGILLVIAATVPLSVFQSGLQMPDFSKLLSKPAEKAALPIPKKTPLLAVGSNSASYVEALDRAASKLLLEINKSPSDPALQNRLGLIYLTLGDSKSAEQCFTNAVSLSRASISAYASNADKLKTQGKMSDASNQVIEASKASVELSAAHSNLARVFDLRGDRRAVMSELEQMNKDGLLFNGFAATNGGRLKSNEKIMSVQDTRQLAQAEALFKGNQLQAALAEYRRLAASNPKLAFLFDRIGLISVMTGDIQEAVAAWEKAAQLNPGSATIRSNLGLAYHQFGMDKESELSYRKALQLDPSQEEAALNLAELLSSRGDYKSATAIMAQASRACPQSARIADNLGTFLMLSGNYPDALSAFHKALRLDPNMASAHYGMGVALLRTHKYSQSIRELKTAIILNPSLHAAQAKIEEAQKAMSRHG